MTFHILEANFMRTEAKDYLKRMGQANRKRMGLTYKELMKFFRYDAFSYVSRRAEVELETLIRTQRNLYSTIYTNNPILTDWDKEEVDMFRAYQIYQRTYLIDSIPDVQPKYQYRPYSLELESTYNRRGTPVITDTPRGIPRDEFYGLPGIEGTGCPPYLRS